MKAERVTIKTVRTLQEPVLGVPADVLAAHTQAKLDALKARFGSAFAQATPRPVERKKALALS